MVLQIVENRLCDGVKLGATTDDFAPRHDPPVRGISRTVAGDEPKLMSVDLCDACDSGPDCLNRDEMRVVIREFGTPYEAGKNDKRHVRPSGNDKIMRCLWCPKAYSKPGFPGHLKNPHGFDSLKQALGTTCPACGQGFDGLSLHITRIHTEFAAVTDAFLWARDNGDPYGVYRERRAAGENVLEALL